MSNIATSNHKCRCGICSRPVNRSDKAIHCGNFLHWIHYKCNGPFLNDYCFYNQVMRYGIANTVLPLYFLFPLSMILHFIAL